MKLRERRGITLVALVITIIILLILAGVTIAQLTGNGLFEKAKLAKEKQEDAQELENVVLADYENKIDEYVKGTREEFEVEEIHFTWLDNIDKANESVSIKKQGNIVVGYIATSITLDAGVFTEIGYIDSKYAPDIKMTVPGNFGNYNANIEITLQSDGKILARPTNGMIASNRNWFSVNFTYIK